MAILVRRSAAAAALAIWAWNGSRVGIIAVGEDGGESAGVTCEGGWDWSEGDWSTCPVGFTFGAGGG